MNETMTDDVIGKCPECDDGIAGTDHQGEAVDCYVCGGSGVITRRVLTRLLIAVDKLESRLSLVDLQKDEIMRAACSQHLYTATCHSVISRVQAELDQNQNRIGSELATLLRDLRFKPARYDHLWSSELPTKAGFYWNWPGGERSVSSLYLSEFGGCFFPDGSRGSRWCVPKEKVGGWWFWIQPPPVPAVGQ